jgi:hypothetical protein
MSPDGSPACGARSASEGRVVQAKAATANIAGAAGQENAIWNITTHCTKPDTHGQ